MQFEQKNSMSELLQFYKEQSKQLKQTVAQYKRKIINYQKQEQRMKQLQKHNSQNTTRLLQCVSNVRDLLHSNKKLREQLQNEKHLREQVQIKFIDLQKVYFQLQKNQPFPKLNIQVQHQEETNGLKALKAKNLHRLDKIQKLSRLKTSSKRYSTENFEVKDESPTRSPTKSKVEVIKQLAKKYQIPNHVIKEEKIKSPSKRSKLVKSVDFKKSQAQYRKALERRKQSMLNSDQKFEQLQYKPFLQKTS